MPKAQTLPRLGVRTSPCARRPACGVALAAARRSGGRDAPLGEAGRGQAPRRAEAATMMSAASSAVKASVLMTRS